MLGFIRYTLVITFLLGGIKFSFSADDHDTNMPPHLRNTNQYAVQKTITSDRQLLSQYPSGDKYHFSLNLQQISINIDVSNVAIGKRNTQSFSSSFLSNSKDWTLIFTQGNNNGFGELFTNGQHMLIEQRGNDVFVVDVGLSGLTPGLYENDVVGDAKPAASFQLQTNEAQSAVQAVTNNNPVIVDVMLLFTQNIVDTYPGDMTQTLLEHLVFKANQSFFDSEIDMRLRLVHTEFVDYPNPSSIVALNELRGALDGNGGAPTDPSLSGVLALQNIHGADLVAMIRTHNLNEREVCGIAMFPDPNVNFLANVSNVGISGGSNCIDTFTHEVGHNFGAGHQAINNDSQGALPQAGALIVSDKFNTLMSSIGTGDINRDFGLPVFSNPNIVCATVPCGDSITADNASTINFFARTNAALRQAVSEVQVPSFFASVIDRDGDDVIDQNDAFPFDRTETTDSDDDGVGDNRDAFLNNPLEQFDTDVDGTGNNADTDDDNDGTPDTSDDLPLDPNDSRDGDGDGVGANTDALDNNFQEVQDSDSDGIGERSDGDDDNDGVPDFFTSPTLAQTEAWVVSAGTHAILQYNTVSGDFVGRLLEVSTGGFSFRSDAILTDSQQLLFVAFSDVLAYDQHTGQIRTVIDRSAMTSNFPAHLLFQDDDTLLINNGLGVSNIESFILGASGNRRTVSTSDVEVWRDFVIMPNNNVVVASRSSNQLLSLSLPLSTTSISNFSNQGLDKPEHIALLPNGNLLVTNAGTNDVSQFDSTGAFLGRFILSGSGGLGIPSCITVGPDGNVYVCSSDTNQVLQYDGQSGAFLDVFIDANEGGLQQPVSIVFASLAQDELRLSGDHDTDNDSVNNIDDDLPLDPTETIDTDNDGTGNNADVDDDNDTLPDTYELANNLDPLDARDANSDNDSDGASNVAEFNAGTDPNDASSVPVIPVLPEPSNDSGGGNMSAVFILFILSVFFLRLRNDHFKACRFDG